MIAGIGQHHAVDQNAGDTHQVRTQYVTVGQPLDLHHDQAAGVVHGLGDRQRFQMQGLALHGDVALGVGGGAAQKGRMDGEGLVKKVLLAVDLHHPDQVFDGAAVEFPAVDTRVREGVQAHRGQRTGSPGRDVSVQMGDDALRQVVGGDLLIAGELTDARYQPHVAADDPAEQTFVAEVIEAAFARRRPGRLRRPGSDRVAERSRTKRCSSALSRVSGTPIPTKPPVARVEPSAIRATASAAVLQLRVALVHTAESSEAWRRNRSCRACSSSMPWSDSSTKTRWVCAA